MKAKFGIKKKLMLFTLPIILVGFIVVIAIAYSSSKSSIESKTERLLYSEASTSTNKIEAWADKNLATLDNAVDTMINLNMNRDEILEYEGFYLNTHEDFPNGIYVVCNDGDVIDATGWAPEGDARDQSYYKEGQSCTDGEAFTTAYMDEYTKEFVVTAARYEDSINDGVGGVVCTDISLGILSQVVSEIQVDGNGDAFIVDTQTGTILAHQDQELAGKTVEEAGDDFYKNVETFVENGKSKSGIMSSATGTYMVSYDVVEGTSWAVVVRAPESNIYSDVRTLGGVLIGVGVLVIILISVVLIVTIQKITTPIKKLTSTIVSVTNGDFTVDVDAKGNDEVPIIEGSMKHFLEVMRGTLSTIVNISDKIDYQATDSNTISGELHESANGQAEAMSQMRSNLEELVESIGVIAENATTLAMVVAETDDSGAKAVTNIEDTMSQADAGRNSMVKVTESMEEMKESMDQLEVSITNVGDAAIKIDNITSTIREIADETNLLALNASIEAARAGEMGKGFAVVATQIKSLAETSGNAASEISELIASVSSLINGTVEQSQNSVEQIRSSSELVNEASAQFNSIYDSIENTNEIVHSIINRIHEANDVASNMAAITEEQSASAEEIEATAVSVQELADAVTSNSANVKSDSHELAGTAANLKEQISEFTI